LLLLKRCCSPNGQFRGYNVPIEVCYLEGISALKIYR